MVLSSTLPSVGAGALKNRDDPKILGTAKVGWVMFSMWMMRLILF